MNVKDLLGDQNDKMNKNESDDEEFEGAFQKVAKC